MARPLHRREFMADVLSSDVDTTQCGRNMHRQLVRSTVAWGTLCRFNDTDAVTYVAPPWRVAMGAASRYLCSEGHIQHLPGVNVSVLAPPAKPDGRQMLDTMNTSVLKRVGRKLVLQDGHPIKVGTGDAVGPRYLEIDLAVVLDTGPSAITQVDLDLLRESTEANLRDPYKDIEQERVCTVFTDTYIPM